MNTPKGNGLDARNDQPAKAHINYATNFIAAYACIARTESAFNSEIQANTSPELATQARTPAKTHVTDETAVTALFHAGLRCNGTKRLAVTAVTARGIKPPTCSALQTRFKVRPAVHAGADGRHDAGGRAMRLTTTQPTSLYVRRQHTTNPDSAAGHSCIHLVRRDTFHATPELLELVLENTIKLAGNLPDSEVFSRPESFGFGRDGFVRKASRTTNFVFSTSRPPVALEKAACGFQSQLGARTMAKANTTPLTGNTSPLARHQAIENALSMALFHIRKGDTQHDIHSAMAKASRAASLLKQACTEVALIGGAA